MMYLIWKVIHVTSVVIFLGNIMTGLFWAMRAHKTQDFKIISSTFQSIIKSDKYFTIPGIIATTVAGIMGAIHGHIPILSTGWIFWSIILFTLSGIFFSAYVSPLQKKIVSFTISSSYSDINRIDYEKLFKKWEFWGFWATITPITAMVIMILKPYLPAL